MRRFLSGFATLILLGAMITADARVVRSAPNFAWTDFNGQAKSLESLRGQAVVLLIAPSPKDRRFRAQIGQLQKAYQRLAAQKLVCFAAFTEEGGRVDSNIPFVVAPDGPRVAFLYDIAEGFAIAIIGPDGNLDYITDDVVAAQRVLDVMDNSFVVQEGFRIDQERSAVP